VAPPPSARVISGRTFILVSGALSFLLLAFSAYFGPRFARQFLEDRPQKLADYHRRLSAALLAYRADHGAFPPEEPWFRYLISQKNFRSFTKPIFPEGQFPPQALYTPYFFSTYAIPSLTTPTAYLKTPRDEGKGYGRRAAGDPYLLPEPLAPALYVNNGDFAVIWSPGPDLVVNTKADRLRGASLEEVESLIRIIAYDPTNGVAKPKQRAIPLPQSLTRPPRGSAGDVFTIVR
jgi:hypothetical protein